MGTRQIGIVYAIQRGDEDPVRRPELTTPKRESCAPTIWRARD